MEGGSTRHNVMKKTTARATHCPYKEQPLSNMIADAVEDGLCGPPAKWPHLTDERC